MTAMNLRRLSSLLLLPALLALGSTADAAPRLRHVPPAEAPPAAALELLASVGQAWESSLELRYRAIGSVEWHSAMFTRRGDSAFAVTIPAEAVAPPGLEYFILGTRPDGSTVLHFASAEHPHPVRVFPAPLELRQERYLARYEHRRASIHLAGEYVDYGSRRFGDTLLPDRYYRIDAGVSYRLLRFPLASLRFGYTHLIGETPLSSRGDDGWCEPTATSSCTIEAGLKGGGWFELRFSIRDGIELDTRGMVMATQEGFNVGTRGELRLGNERGNHLALGTEIIADVGTAGFVRLGWGTVPDLPMAATVEVTDFPAPHRAAAVRLVYDVARPLANGLLLGARVGYQARDQRVGGVTLGLNTTFDF